mgnify:CR=1 FL=1
MINKKLGKTLALLACVSISLYPANQGRAYSGNDAMKYAEKWYNGYNTKQYYKAGKDCTNFPSVRYNKNIFYLFPITIDQTFNNQAIRVFIIH